MCVLASLTVFITPTDEILFKQYFGFKIPALTRTRGYPCFLCVTYTCAAGKTTSSNNKEFPTLQRP